jgi:hypothetical protein
MNSRICRDVNHALCVMARDVTPSLGTALDRLAHSARVGVVTELNQFGALAASGRGASRAWHQQLIEML